MTFLKLKIFKSPLFWLFLIVIIASIIIGKTAYVKLENSENQNNLTEMTVIVEKQSLGVKVQASGTVEPIQNVNISPKNPGILAQLLVEQGDSVKQGQTVAIMENAQIQAQILQSEANLNRALSNLEQAKIRIPSEIKQFKLKLDQEIARLEEISKRIPRDLDQAKAKITQAQSRLDLAQIRLNRYEYLEKEGAITTDRLDEVINEYNSAKANLSDLQQQQAQIEQTTPSEISQQEAVVNNARIALKEKEDNAAQEIKLLEAEVNSVKAQLKQIEIQFRDTIITAPFEGIITQKFATVGAFVTPTTSASSTASATSSSILALAQGLEIIAKVPEIDMAQLKVGQGVEILADAFPDETFKGRIKRIAPEAIVEQNVTSFEVAIALSTGEEKLRSKMNVDVTFIGEDIKNTLVVPTVAILTQEGKTGVLIADEKGQPKFIPVVLGLTLEDKTQILQGLKAGDRIFIDLPEGYNQKNQDE